MSKITTAYNAILTSTSALFPSKTRLHNPYTVEENPDLVRKDSWGLKVNDGNRQDIEYCNLSIERAFTFILLRQLVTLAGKEDGFDAITLALLEDQQSFCNLIFSPSEIGEPNSIDRIEISNISGIQELATGEKKYLFCEVSFNITLSELIS
jgi:hypothetical protein